MKREYHVDPVQLLLAALAIIAALTHHYTAGIIFAALAGTSSLQVTWTRR
jgi:hypothetical protein